MRAKWRSLAVRNGSGLFEIMIGKCEDQKLSLPKAAHQQTLNLKENCVSLSFSFDFFFFKERPQEKINLYC